jgi:hypothetical protein
VVANILSGISVVQVVPIPLSELSVVHVVPSPLSRISVVHVVPTPLSGISVIHIVPTPLSGIAGFFFERGMLFRIHPLLFLSARKYVHRNSMEICRSGWSRDYPLNTSAFLPTVVRDALRVNHGKRLRRLSGIAVVQVVPTPLSGIRIGK